MRWLPPPVLVLAVLPAALAAPAPKPAVKDEPFWPTAVGTKWVYNFGGGEVTEEITKSEAIKDGTKLTVTRSEEQSQIEVTSKGVVLRVSGSYTLDLQMLRFPIKAGDSWTFAYPMQKGLQSDAGTMTVGEDEDIKVGAGAFRATKVVRTVTTVGGLPIEKPRVYTYWFVRGVGLVKQQYDGVTLELKSFTPGKK